MIMSIQSFAHWLILWITGDIFSRFSSNSEPFALEILKKGFVWSTALWCTIIKPYNNVLSVSKDLSKRQLYGECLEPPHRLLICIGGPQNCNWLLDYGRIFFYIIILCFFFTYRQAKSLYLLLIGRLAFIRRSNPSICSHDNRNITFIYQKQIYVYV